MLRRNGKSILETIERPGWPPTTGLMSRRAGSRIIPGAIRAQSPAVPAALGRYI